LVAGATDHVEYTPVRHRADIAHKEQAVAFENPRQPRRTTNVNARSSTKTVERCLCKVGLSIARVAGKNDAPACFKRVGDWRHERIGYVQRPPRLEAQPIGEDGAGAK
jgi:hypothetical protein